MPKTLKLTGSYAEYAIKHLNNQRNNIIKDMQQLDSEYGKDNEGSKLLQFDLDELNGVFDEINKQYNTKF